MQVALPRTQDAGKLQDQMSKNNERFQGSLAQSQLKQELLKRKRVNKFEKTSKKQINKENESSEDFPERDNDTSHSPEEPNLTHPYLGKEIDFSG